MLAYLAWLVGSKSQSQAISGGLKPKMDPRLANLGPERRPFGGPKMPDSSRDLRLEAIWAELGIMLAYLAWLVGSKSQSPAISGGLEPKMGPRLANLGLEKRPFGGPKMPDSNGDLCLEVIWAELGIMLACLA